MPNVQAPTYVCAQVLRRCAGRLMLEKGSSCAPYFTGPMRMVVHAWLFSCLILNSYPRPPLIRIVVADVLPDRQEALGNPLDSLAIGLRPRSSTGQLKTSAALLSILVTDNVDQQWDDDIVINFGPLFYSYICRSGRTHRQTGCACALNTFLPSCVLQ